MSAYARQSRHQSADPSATAHDPRSPDAQDLHGNAFLAEQCRGKPTPDEMSTYLGQRVLANLGTDGAAFSTAPAELPTTHWARYGNQAFTFRCIAKSASDAIDAVYASGSSLECNLAAQLAAFAALRDALGKRKFDKRYGGKNELILSSSAAFRLDGIAPLTDVDAPDVQPGDLSYAQNHPGYRLRHPDGAWAGENCALVQDDQWMGFGVPGTFDEAGIRDMLAARYNDAPSGEAHWAAEAEKAAGTHQLPVEEARGIIDAHLERAPESIGATDVPGLDARRTGAAQAEIERDELELKRALLEAAGAWSAGTKMGYDAAMGEVAREEAETATLPDGRVLVRRIDAQAAIDAGGRVRRR